MNDLFTMHPRYAEFLAFMADCPHRKKIEHLEIAFWVWLKSGTRNISADLDRLHRERDSFQRQCAVMASENERLNDESDKLKNKLFFINSQLCNLKTWSIIEKSGSFEKDCMAIDGGNL